ncbi:MAG: peptidase serine carboxypeptidase [Rhizobacter sp.]|nr:peptidase serine carboxypeptidase [Rhizobacter sp.]
MPLHRQPFLRSTSLFKRRVLAAASLCLAGAWLAACGDNADNPDNAPVPADQPYTDTLAYGAAPGDSVSEHGEGAAVTHHTVDVGGNTLAYTATAGHLVAVDPVSSRPNARFFYVAYTVDSGGQGGASCIQRPVTFVYNGGPGSASVFLLLGSFGPKRLNTSLPDFTPGPYTLTANADTLLDKTDLVFVNPIGTGLSSAVSPYVNQDFWGVDSDAASLVGFIGRYLSANSRWNSPKFLMGESYGTPRSAVLSYALHQAGIDLNGVTLISSVLDESKVGRLATALPSYAATAWYHGKARGPSASGPLMAHIEAAQAFVRDGFGAALDRGDGLRERLNELLFAVADPALQARVMSVAVEASTYAELIAALARAGQDEAALAAQVQALVDTAAPVDVALLDRASDFVGLDRALVRATRGFDVFDFEKQLLADVHRIVSVYDGRATGTSLGIAGRLPTAFGTTDPTLQAINGAFTAGWNHYLATELAFTTTSNFVGLNFAVNTHWDYRHTDPAGVDRGGPLALYTAGDLAATLSINPDLRVFEAGGVYDGLTTFAQAEEDLRGMPMDPALQANVELHRYPSGHVIYLDAGSRSAMKKDLSAFYDAAAGNPKATARILERQGATQQRLGRPAAVAKASSCAASTAGL